MKIVATDLIEDLIERTRQHLNQAEQLKIYSFEALNRKPSSESWSALECLEHVNLYGDFYIPEIEKRMTQSKFQAEKDFKSGWLGNYFAKSMLPKDKLNKMNTFKDKNPNGSSLDKKTIDRFIHQQNQLLTLLNKARKVSLTKTKTGVTISPWIKLRLGDIFRVVIYHNQRHFVQIFNALE